MRFPLREAEISNLASAFPRRLAPYHSAVRPFSPWSHPMLWFSLNGDDWTEVRRPCDGRSCAEIARACTEE